ncbi:hypothetical protein AGLY_006729 [Aphis glycines]|uniref:Uncharacterized protein n=1 Tax=Aphis glycines TaxID=307491 RepID=A0A6G0TQK3_APHGL|nr:hypothetical protein AGLY_006729 [Aphis glycines]
MNANYNQIIILEMFLKFITLNKQWNAPKNCLQFARFPSQRLKKQLKYSKHSEIRRMNFSKTLSVDRKKVGKWVPLCCTLGGGVDLGLGAKKFYRHFKNNFSEKLKISVLKKTQNILKIKSCKENANLNNWKTYGKLSATIKTTHKEPCIKFSKLFGHPKIFYQHFKKNFSKKSKISVFLNYNHKKKNRFGRKLVLRKNCRFSVIFFFVFLDFFENCWKMLTFYLYNAPRIFTFTSETIPIV